MRFWLVMGAFLVVMPLVVVGLQHPPGGIDSDRFDRLEPTGHSRLVGRDEAGRRLQERVDRIGAKGHHAAADSQRRDRRYERVTCRAGCRFV